MCLGSVTCTMLCAGCMWPAKPTHLGADVVLVLLLAAGEDDGGVSSLLVLLLPALLVPCMCVGLVMAVGSITAQRKRAASPDDSSDSDDFLDERLLAAAYSSLPGGPSDGSDSVDYRRGAVPQRALGLITRTFNLKAMSRRAQARRLRRSARPVYVGLPQECAAQQQMYATGTLQPGPNSLVAPCFRWAVLGCRGVDAVPVLLLVAKR
jgi:hypothetical protein